MLVPIGALAIAALALLVALATYVRNGDWERSKAGAAIKADLNNQDRRITTLEADMKHLATKADVERLTSEIEAVADKVKTVGAGVNRIEDILLSNAK